MEDDVKKTITSLIRVVAELSKRTVTQGQSIEAAGDVLFRHDWVIRGLLPKCRICEQPATLVSIEPVVVRAGANIHHLRCDRCLATAVAKGFHSIEEFIEVDNVHLVRDIVDNDTKYNGLIPMTLH